MPSSSSFCRKTRVLQFLLLADFRDVDSITHRGRRLNHDVDGGLPRGVGCVGQDVGRMQGKGGGNQTKGLQGGSGNTCSGSRTPQPQWSLETGAHFFSRDGSSGGVPSEKPNPENGTARAVAMDGEGRSPGASPTEPEDGAARAVATDGEGGVPTAYA